MTQSSDTRTRVTVLILMAVIALSAASMFRTGITPRYKPDLMPFKALGTVAAEETARLVGGTGQIVVWRWGANRLLDVYSKAQWELFTRTLKEHPGISILAVEDDAPGPDAIMDAELRMPTERFLALLKQYRTADALVVFGISPLLRNDDFARLETKHPKILVCNGGMPLQRDFMKGLLHAAIIPRSQPDTATSKPRNPREWFDRNFMVVTLDNASVLP